MILIVKKYALHLLLIILCSYFISIPSALAANAHVRNHLAKATNQKQKNSYAFHECRDRQSKSFDKTSNKKKILIIGDSQGCDFLNGIIENNYLNDYQISFRFIPYPCQRIPGDPTERYIKPKHRWFCLQSGRADNLKATKEQAHNADLVIFAELWKKEVAQRIPQTFRYLGINKNQRVIVIGRKFFGKIAIKNYFHMQDRELRVLRNEVGFESQEINNILKAKVAKKAIFIDPHQLVCGNAQNCPVFTEQLRLISYDGRHLTKAGARYMGKILFENTMLGNI